MWGLQFPFAVHVFCGVTPYGLMGWNRALQKNNFSSSEKMFFFRTCLDCFQTTQNLYVDRLGDLKHCFPPITWRKLRLFRKTTFQAPKKLFLFARWTASNPKIYIWIDLGTWNRALQQLWRVARAVWLWKADYRKPRKRQIDRPF